MSCRERSFQPIMNEDSVWRQWRRGTVDRKWSGYLSFNGFFSFLHTRTLALREQAVSVSPVKAQKGKKVARKECRESAKGRSKHKGKQKIGVSE